MKKFLSENTKDSRCCFTTP